jgi:Lon protease-like protein
VNEQFSIPDGFDGTVRLFPLPNVVLFPRVTLPLHIFEPRYRQMTTDSLAGDRLIAMALLRPGWEPHYDAKPALYPIACVGKVVADQALEDGRYNLVLRGLSRARILREIECERLYRTAQVQLLSDTDSTTPADSRKLCLLLARLARKWFTSVGVDFEQVSRLFKGNLPIGTIGDVLSFVLPLPPEVKQELLEQLNVERRISRLVNYLQEKQPSQSESTSAAKFPPEFSLN